MLGGGEGIPQCRGGEIPRCRVGSSSTGGSPNALQLWLPHGGKGNPTCLGEKRKLRITDNSLLFELSPIDHKHAKKETFGKEEKEHLEVTKTSYVVRSTMPRQLLFKLAESVATTLHHCTAKTFVGTPELRPSYQTWFYHINVQLATLCFGTVQKLHYIPNAPTG